MFAGWMEDQPYRWALDQAENSSQGLHLPPSLIWTLCPPLMPSLWNQHAVYQGGYFGNILRIHPGNVSPVTQPKELRGDTADVPAPAAKQLPKCCPFMLNISLMVLLTLLTFSNGNHAGIHIPTYRRKAGKRNVTKLAERSRRIFAYPAPTPKPKAQAVRHLRSSREKVECSQAKVCFALLHFALFSLCDYK